MNGQIRILHKKISLTRLINGAGGSKKSDLNEFTCAHLASIMHIICAINNILVKFLNLLIYSIILIILRNCKQINVIVTMKVKSNFHSRWPWYLKCIRHCIMGISYENGGMYGQGTNCRYEYYNKRKL